MNKIKFFYYNEAIPLQTKTNFSYLEHLESRGKISINRMEGIIYLKDFGGYINGTLYIPKKLEILLSLKNTQQYQTLFNNLFSTILKYFNDDILFQLFPTKFGMSKHEYNPSKIFQLNTIIKNKQKIIFALNLIKKNTHKKLVESRVYNNYSDVSYIDDVILLDILEHPEYWENKTPTKPRKILQYNNFETFDTTENRFIKFFLMQILGHLKNLIEYTNEIQSQKLELIEIKYAIKDFFEDFPVDEIKELTLFPYNSQVLLKRDGYKELFDLHNRLHYSSKPSFLKNIENAISLKDLSSLWEYFVMVKLIDEFGAIESQEIEENLKIKNETYEKAIIKFKNGITLYYQNVITSYSKIKFRPDFYLKFQDKKVVLDAKFRIMDKNRTDILKNMHHYKDGLQVNSAIAIVIDNKNHGEFYSINNETHLINNLSEIFNYDGVGFLSFNLMDLL